MAAKTIILKLSMVKREKKINKILLRLARVMEKTDLERVTINLNIKQNIFSKQFKIDQRTVDG
ncbi:hypothetical protein SASC598P14_005680 [Snodgrassella alvi SCGC AB-598-P14]|nr:hypothetical protein SASC598P14_005680 [Snodgrassella alvi SCGC AB-598-P14]